ncbi:hypothetical protein HDA32_003982 [Spinactinospora alkalitolerans]|uniref:HEPN domain-containing protein n=1 Tax=Spinactinospora alkalitolerans TaxID=687207 RepID=A0A852U0K1_9ACTN|nr:hypothetical protein [Spinactinospora alkalitolerans]NYE48862.1 hypothetical protein [Spinactinospora alkalitolerans]
MTASPSELLARADGLLAPSSGAAIGARHRAAAFLLRLALEEALRRYWSRTRPELNGCSPHVRSLCLEFYSGPGASGRWSASWGVLSRACHYHSYGFAPSAAELRSWREEVAEVVQALSDSPS